MVLSVKLMVQMRVILVSQRLIVALSALFRMVSDVLKPSITTYRSLQQASICTILQSWIGTLSDKDGLDIFQLLQEPLTLDTQHLNRIYQDCGTNVLCSSLSDSRVVQICSLQVVVSGKPVIPSFQKNDGRCTKEFITTKLSRGLLPCLLDCKMMWVTFLRASPAP